MKKILFYIALILFSIALLFQTAYHLGAKQKPEDSSAYYVTEGHCVGYISEKNRTSFRTPTGIEYYYYGNFVYEPESLDYWLVMNNHHSEYLLDDWIVNITPIPKD